MARFGSKQIRVVDFFCGCGGTCAGLQKAGMKVLLGIDVDADAEKTFRANFPKSEFLRRDITKVVFNDLYDFLPKAENRGVAFPLLFSACAPCQPFSKQNQHLDENDRRRSLLSQFHRFVEHFLPEYIFVENVPGLQNISPKSGVFGKFLSFLAKNQYNYEVAVIAAEDYGIPQCRRRLIVLASRLGNIPFPVPTHGPHSKNIAFSTVGDWIKDIPPLKAGQTDKSDHNHRAAALSPLNFERIKATPIGGSRKDWPKHLILDCHKAHSGHSDVYGRLHWDKPAPALTTRCISLSNGRFGHPKQHRAISVREAACLQTFDRQFVFHGNLNSMAKQIGNAVPVLLAEKFGREIIRHFNAYMKEQVR